MGLIRTFSCCDSGLRFSLTSWAQLNWSNVVCPGIKWISIFKLNPQPILIIQLASDSGPTSNSKISDTVLVAICHGGCTTLTFDSGATRPLKPRQPYICWPSSITTELLYFLILLSAFFFSSAIWLLSLVEKKKKKVDGLIL